MNKKMINKIIFIADHTGQFSKSVLSYLNHNGFTVVAVNNKATAFRKFRQIQPNVVLIHEKFPDIELHRIIKIIQTCNREIPIILIVSDPTVANVVSAFHLCVSDCITADIDPTILVQRIRRSLTTLAPEKPKIPLGRSLYLPHDFQILCDNKEHVTLLPMENQLLLLLCDKLGEICTNEELTRAIWGQKYPEKKHPPSHWRMNLDSLVHELRKKLSQPDYICIKNMKKVGYRLLVK